MGKGAPNWSDLWQTTVSGRVMTAWLQGAEWAEVLIAHWWQVLYSRVCCWIGRVLWSTHDRRPHQLQLSFHTWWE